MGRKVAESVKTLCADSATTIILKSKNAHKARKQAAFAIQRYETCVSFRDTFTARGRYSERIDEEVIPSRLSLLSVSVGFIPHRTLKIL